MKTIYALFVVWALTSSARAAEFENAAVSISDALQQAAVTAQQAVQQQQKIGMSSEELQSSFELLAMAQAAFDNLRKIALDPAPRAGIVINKDYSVVGLDSPAAEAGIQMGDIVTQVDKQPVGGLELVAVLQLIGQAASPVQITIVRGGAEQTFSVTKRNLALTGTQAQEVLAHLDSGQKKLDLVLKGLGENTYTVSEFEHDMGMSLIQDFNAAVLAASRK